MSVIYEIDPTTALQRGLERFNISWRNVGNTGASADGESLITNPQQFSVAGIAIAPGSIITQVQIRSVTSPPFGSSQIVTPTSPFIGDIPAPWEASIGTVGRFGDTYFPTGSVVATPFGGTMGNDPAGTPIFGGVATGNFPVCDLIAYLRPPSSALNADTRLFNQSTAILVGAGTNVVRVLCVQGRRRLRAVFKASGTGSYNAQITGAPGGTVPSTIEFALSAAVTVTPPGENVVVIDPLVDVHWIFIKLTRNAGAPVAYWQLTAE